MMKGVKSEPGKVCSDQKPSNNPVIASIAEASSEKSTFQGKGNDLMIPTGIRNEHLKIPKSNETVNKVQVKRKKPTVTTSAQDKKSIVALAKPSTSSKNLYRKWQMAAEEMGFMGQIIVDKVQAKQIIFDWLHDQFRPKTINDIYKVNTTELFQYVEINYVYLYYHTRRSFLCLYEICRPLKLVFRLLF